MQNALHAAACDFERNGRRPTITDVAREAGVSPSTVSHVFSRRRPTSAQTDARVHAVAEALGYRPSLTAQTLVTGRSRLIALVVPDLLNPFYASVAGGVEEAAAEAGLSVIIGNTDMRAEKEDHLVGVLEARGVDGIVFITDVRARQPALERLARRGTPIVTLDEEVEGGFHLVAVDNEGGSRQVAEHLIARGHRRLGVVAGPAGLPTTRARLRGFRAGLGAGLLPSSRIVYADDRLEGGRRAARGLLGGRDRPTALFATNDLMALGAVAAARELRLGVPQEVSIVGFDDIPFAALADPPLTTVAQPAAALGRVAATMLLDAMRTPDEPAMRVQLPVELVVRASTAPVPADRSTEDS
jgi:LacI family transcriptional regulator